MLWGLGGRRNLRDGGRWSGVRAVDGDAGVGVNPAGVVAAADFEHMSFDVDWGAGGAVLGREAVPCACRGICVPVPGEDAVS